jgi:hypothetical protein
MNNVGKKKSLKEIDLKYNSSRDEDTKEELMISNNIIETSKMDLSEIQEENPIAEPVNTFQATDRSIKKPSMTLNQEKIT